MADDFSFDLEFLLENGLSMGSQDLNTEDSRAPYHSKAKEFLFEDSSVKSIGTFLPFTQGLTEAFLVPKLIDAVAWLKKWTNHSAIVAVNALFQL